MPITQYIPQYFEPIEHSRAEEARQKGMTVEQLLKLERKNQQSPGVVIEDKRDAYQNMRASVKNNPREAQRQKEGEAKAKENAARAFNGALAMGMPSTYYNLFNLDNQLSNKQALILDLGSGLLLGGMGIATGRRALQKGIQQSQKRNYADLFTDGPVRTYGKVKYYGPTMGKTTASNSTLIDFDDVVRPKIEQLAKSKGVSPKDLKIVSDPDYVQLINDEVVKWSLNPSNDGKTLMISNKVLSNPNKVQFIYDNTPSIPSRESFIRRNVNRGGTVKDSEEWYNALLQENPDLQLDNRFVETIEHGPVQPTTSKLTEAERLGIPRGERSQYLRGTTADPSYYSGLGLNNPNYLQKLRDFHFIRKAPNTVFVNIDNTPARLYHGTPVKGWHSWDKTKFGKSTDIGMYGEGVYTTSHKDYAKVYALNNTPNGEIAGEIKEVYGNAENPFYVYWKDISPLESSQRYEAAYQFGRQAKSQGNVSNDVWKEMLNSDAIIEEYGLKRPNFSEVVFPSNGMQIKYTSPITYDNDGRIIPLSKRDNFKINDWRYKSGGKINYLKFFK